MNDCAQNISPRQGSASEGQAFRKEWEPLAVMRYYRRTGRSQPGRGDGEKVFQGQYRTAGPVFFRENFKNRKENFHIYQGRQWAACVPGRGKDSRRRFSFGLTPGKRCRWAGLPEGDIWIHIFLWVRIPNRFMLFYISRSQFMR